MNACLDYRGLLIVLGACAAILFWQPVFADELSAPELVVQTGHSVGVHWTRFSPVTAWSKLGFPDRKDSGEIIATGSNDGTVEKFGIRLNSARSASCGLEMARALRRWP